VCKYYSRARELGPAVPVRYQGAAVLLQSRIKVTAAAYKNQQAVLLVLDHQPWFGVFGRLAGHRQPRLHRTP
jgi:hypothetical protein